LGEGSVDEKPTPESVGDVEKAGDTDGISPYSDIYEGVWSEMLTGR
jgi:hypothetical protein